ncbi:MAG TPA: hypothetical protein VJH94_02310, partial [Candidatus Paceibacterota bacterium]
KPYRCCPAYLFSETKDNEDSVMTQGIHMLSDNSAQILCIINDVTGTNSGYPGATVWRKKLLRQGALLSEIAIIPCREQLNTYTESFAVATHAKENGWKNLTIVAPPFHQLRAFTSICELRNSLFSRFHTTMTTDALRRPLS